MKKVYIIFIIFLIFFSYGLVMGSPIEKGSFLISGDFSFNNSGGNLYEDIDGNRLTSISMGTSINYFVIPRLAFGGNFAILYNSQGDISLSAFGIGPTVSLYFGRIDPKTSFKNQVFPFVSAGFSYLRGSETIGGVNSISNGTMVNFGGGITYMVTNTVGLSMRILYHIDHINYEDGTSYNGNAFNIGVGFKIFFYEIDEW